MQPILTRSQEMICLIMALHLASPPIAAPPLGSSPISKIFNGPRDTYSNLIIATSLYDQWIYIVAIYNDYGSEFYYNLMEFGLNWDISRLIAFSYGTEIAISDASLAVGINNALLISYSESTPYESPWSTVKAASSIDNGLSFSTTIVDQYDKIVIIDTGFKNLI